MKRYVRARWQESVGTNIVEDVSRVSADLPYELQSKMFDQLAALGLAGAGLTVFSGRPNVVRSKIYTGLTLALIGIAVGALSMGVYYDGKHDRAHSDQSKLRG